MQNSFWISKKIEGRITAPNFTPALKTSDEITKYSKTSQCFICHSKFSSKEGCTNFDPCHISGRFRGALCRKFNLKLGESYQTDDVSIFFHNFERFDSHLLPTHMRLHGELDSLKVSIIASNTEKIKALILGPFNFKDSCLF